MASLLETLTLRIAAGSTLIVLAIFLAGLRFLMGKWYGESSGCNFRVRLIMLLASFAAFVAVIVALPVGEALTTQFLNLLWLLLSTATGLSSARFLGNIRAGFTQKAVRSFRPGDFISVGADFGRVSAQGLFHLEIQTEERHLVTLPNLLLTTHPVKVIRSSGTLITGEGSLVYDVQRRQVQKLLIEAALKAELEEPFVQVRKLGDVAGLLREVKRVISTRSCLKEMMLDELHRRGVRSSLRPS